MNRKNKTYIFIIAFFLFAMCLMTIYLRGFDGYVLDSVTGEPIKDAYILITIDLYPCNGLCNVGGPNSEPVAIDLVKTNDAGRFRVPSFFTIHAGWLGSRNFYIYKSGYYFRSFVQKSKMSMSLYEDITDTKKAALSSYDGAYLFYFQKETEKDYGISALLTTARVYVDHVKDKNPWQFIKQLPIYFELYNLFKDERERVMHSSWTSFAKDGWLWDLRSFEADIGKKSE